MEKFTKQVLQSWSNVQGNVNSYDDILNWINERIAKTVVNIAPTELSKSKGWEFDEVSGSVRNKNNGFFSVVGLQQFEAGEKVAEQPIILQPEIGYLGIIAKEIDGVLNFLMQAKIEPGNLNSVQISPTIQATKSNFTAKHGGKKPPYLDYFLNAGNYNVIYDQIQSEQSSRFFKKRNRNILIEVNDEIQLLDNFTWMTLGQIKKMMDEDNIINMDTRTVLSGIPFATTKYDLHDLNEFKAYFDDATLFSSIFEANPSDYLPAIFQKMNNYKMFHETTTKFVPMDAITSWSNTDKGIFKAGADFSVRYFDIAIEGREIAKWDQPLFVAEGIAELGLMMRDNAGTKEFLIKLRPEIGAMDNVEFGPSIQWESTERGVATDVVEALYLQKVAANESIERNVLLSEEGGRFYHEQNVNVIMTIAADELADDNLPADYAWVSFSTLNYLVQVNNVLNIQLRNLLSMINI